MSDNGKGGFNLENLLSGDISRIPEINKTIPSLGSVLKGKNRCITCKNCLQIGDKDSSSLYCFSGKVYVAPDPSRSGDCRVFNPSDSRYESVVHDMTDLPFPPGYYYNCFGDCSMYEKGLPVQIDSVDSDDASDGFSFELDALMAAKRKLQR